MPDARPPLSSAFGLPFEEQIAFFRSKLKLGTARWDDIWQSAHDKAFVVAGATKASLLQDLFDAVAPLQRQSQESFTKKFLEAAEKNNWHGWTGEDSEKGKAWRARVVYETNIRTSYAAGRYAQLTDPDLLAIRPYWRYVHSDLSKEHPRELHKLWGDMKLTLRHDDPFWQTHYPPNGWFCRCSVVAVEAPAKDAAKAPPPGWNAINPKTGAPAGIDKGWAYAPGATRADEIRAMVAEKLTHLPAPIGAGFGASLPADAIAAGFAIFFDNAYKNRAKPQGKHMVVGALEPAWVDRAAKAGVAPETAEIAITDRKISHTFRDVKVSPLPVGWFRELPAYLKKPQAVILDTTHTGEPAFLLFYDTQGEGKKLVIRINYNIRKVGKMNLVESGRTLDAESIASIKAQVGKGYELIEGGL
ncbi:MAG: hypothetical protein LBI87_09550 [Candidatus Accumulibacter sp.]|jgi:hypothetical protein|nr:hypothetical protein [Accumulibacter sp.]